MADPRADKIKLILTDIDGTILPYGDPRISARCARALHAALDAGIHVGPASGRSQLQLGPLFSDDEALFQTALCTNGMQVVFEGDKIYEAVLERQGLVDLAAWCREVDQVGLVCFDGLQPLIVEGTREELAQSFPKYAPQAVYVDEVPAGPTVKANVYVVGDRDRTQAMVDRLNEEMAVFTFDVPEPSWSNITPRGWTKASGIDLICDRLGIGLDQVVVFGDGGNDIPMLSHVPASACVEAAPPDVQAAARYHLGPCEDEVVAAAIEQIAAGTWPFS